MSGRKKFEPEKIAAALRLLRALPVKDTRKTTGEALHMLKGGIQDALDKGYDRTEIRRLIAAEVPISSTTFNDFLAANLKEEVAPTGTEAEAKRKTEQEETAAKPEQTGNGAPGKPESPAVAEQKPAASETGNAASGNRNSPDSEASNPTPARKDKIKLPSYYTPDLPDSEL